MFLQLVTEFLVLMRIRIENLNRRGRCCCCIVSDCGHKRQTYTQGPREDAYTTSKNSVRLVSASAIKFCHAKRSRSIPISHHHFQILKIVSIASRNVAPARPCSTIVNPMDSARIAELLEPFLRAPIPAEAGPSSRTLRGWETPAPSGFLEGCHSEQGQRRGEACPEPSRRESAVRSANGQR